MRATLQPFLVSEEAGGSFDLGIAQVWFFNHSTPVCVSKTATRNMTKYPVNPE